LSDQAFELVWMQRLGGGSEVLRRGIPAADALKVLEQADREDHGPGGMVLLRPDGATAAAQQAEAQAAALRSAAKSAATLLFNLNQRGRLGLDVHAAIDETLAPLDAALATDAGASLLAELTQLRIRVDTLEAIIRGAGEQLGQGDIPLAVAIARLRTAHMEAWKLIGRCDMALELVEVARSIRGARARASEMRAEIKKAM
jgi:hypothetical protein